MSADDLPCLSTTAIQDFLHLSVPVREFRLVRVPCLALTTAASDRGRDPRRRRGSGRVCISGHGPAIGTLTVNGQRWPVQKSHNAKP